MVKKRLHTFLDKLRLYVKGGTGGLGIAKYGGVGGKGGDVYVIGATKINLWKLKKLYPTQRFNAEAGQHSSGTFLAGKPGVALKIDVPPGISILTDKGIVLGNIDNIGDKVLVAKGGKGGSSENNFIGEKGDAHSISLDLKLIADVGLVGFPNAGKSTLLKALSRASPKIASYPFTTIEPRLGIIEFDDHRQISMADLPGLIEGSYMNHGMGHKFLKHVERTKLLLFIVDLNGFRLNVKQVHRTAIQNILLLNRELELYNEDLLSKPSILVVNKIDLDNSTDKVNNIIEKVTSLKDNLNCLPDELRPKHIIDFKEIVTISAKEKLNTDFLKIRLRHLLDEFDSNVGNTCENVNVDNIYKERLVNKIIKASTEYIGLRGV